MAKRHTFLSAVRLAAALRVGKTASDKTGFATGHQIETPSLRAKGLVSLAPTLPDRLVPMALAEIETIADADLQSDALVAIAPRLDSLGLWRAVTIATKIPEMSRGKDALPQGFARANAVCALAPLIQREDTNLLFGLLHATFEIADANAKSHALKALMASLPEEVFKEVFEGRFSTDEQQSLTRKVFAQYVKSSKTASNTETLRKLEEKLRLKIIHDGSKTDDLNKKLQFRPKRNRNPKKQTSHAPDELNYRENVDNTNKKKLQSSSQYPITDTGPNSGTTGEDEGDVRRRVREIQQLWEAVLEAENVPESEREVLIAKFRIEIARTTRPKWKGRLERGGQLATLSAPIFLKRVHAADIAPDGAVRTKVIRAIDPELLQAVVLYISQRKSRGQDLGDAKGLKFVLSRPRRLKRQTKRSRAGVIHLNT